MIVHDSVNILQAFRIHKTLPVIIDNEDKDIDIFVILLPQFLGLKIDHCTYLYNSPKKFYYTLYI